MRRLFSKSALCGSLLMGIGVLCFGSTRDDSRLPGREVGSNEASLILGTACSDVVSKKCTSLCTGNRAQIGTGSCTENSGGGCAANCTASSVTGTCNGG